MTEDFKKWLYTKNGFTGEMNCINSDELSIEILIKAMWKVNREGDYSICLDTCSNIQTYKGNQLIKFINKKDHNNSEQEALTAALKHIFEQEQK